MIRFLRRAKRRILAAAAAIKRARLRLKAAYRLLRALLLLKRHARRLGIVADLDAIQATALLLIKSYRKKSTRKSRRN